MKRLLVILLCFRVFWLLVGDGPHEFVLILLCVWQGGISVPAEGVFSGKIFNITFHQLKAPQ